MRNRQVGCNAATTPVSQLSQSAGLRIAAVRLALVLLPTRCRHAAAAAADLISSHSLNEPAASAVFAHRSLFLLIIIQAVLIFSFTEPLIFNYCVKII